MTNRQIFEQEQRIEQYKKKDNLSNSQMWDLLNYILNGIRQHAGKPLVDPRDNPYKSI